MKFHNDMFLWRTICDVASSVSEEKREYIYSQLYGKMWSIAKIEALMN